MKRIEIQYHAIDSSVKSKDDEIKRLSERISSISGERQLLEERISNLRETMSQQEATIKERMEIEFQDFIAKLDRENKEWAEQLKKSTEDKISEKENQAQREIENLQNTIMQELSRLESEKKRERETAINSLASKDKKIKELEEEVRSLNLHLETERIEWEKVLRKNEQETLRSSKEELKTKLTALEDQFNEERNELSSKLNSMEKELSQLQTERDATIEEKVALSRQMRSEISALERKHAQEIEKLKDVMQPKKEQKAHGFIPKIKAWLNKPVIQIGGDE